MNPTFQKFVDDIDSFESEATIVERWDEEMADRSWSDEGEIVLQVVG